MELDPFGNSLVLNSNSSAGLCLAEKSSGVEGPTVCLLRVLQGREQQQLLELYLHPFLIQSPVIPFLVFPPIFYIFFSLEHELTIALPSPQSKT